MFEPIKRKLSLKVSLILTVIIVPIMAVGLTVVVSREKTRLEQLTLNEARAASQTAARAYGALLEAGLDAGEYTLTDLLQPSYEEIKGYDFGPNPRYHTKFDGYTDRMISGLLNATLDSSPDFLFAVGQDVNGYVPTHAIKFTQPLTGDRAKDLTGNRVKRKYTDDVAAKAAASLAPALVQYHERDTGEHVFDVSSPIFVHGNHFGTFRVAVSMVSLDAAKRLVLIELLVAFAVLGAATIGFIFFMLRRAMKPLVELTDLGNQISLGEGLDREVAVKTSDEIGQMARSMNRLRASLQVVMSRLGE